MGNGTDMSRRPGVRFLSVLLFAAAAGGSGCALERSYVQSENARITLEEGQLEEHGLAFITPASVTGQEQDIQTVALVFSRVFATRRPDIPLVTLPEMLGRINRADLADDYRAMLAHHRDTGVFPHRYLTSLQAVSGARYVAQLKLADFRQDSEPRWGVLGFRVLETKRASLRIFLQVWDAERGEIAWEGMEEVSYAQDTATEAQISLQMAVRTAARRMISAMPGGRPVTEEDKADD